MIKPNVTFRSGDRRDSPFLRLLLVLDGFVAELLAEYEKLTPFQSVLPHSCRLLNQEILRVTTLLGNAQILDQAGLEHARPLASGGIYSTGRSDVNIWASPHQSEISSSLHQSSPQSWLGYHGNGEFVKKTIRVDIPVDKYPNVCIKY
ncbi:hypothetical protein Droror1_Dr00014318 [Drosera rotundifolia]